MNKEETEKYLGIITYKLKDTYKLEGVSGDNGAERNTTDGEETTVYNRRPQSGKSL